jgi:hypothetical protein
MAVAVVSAFMRVMRTSLSGENICEDGAGGSSGRRYQTKNQN